MMIVATELKPSAIHGLGVFLLQPVRRGELIWRFDSRIDRVYCEEEVESLPPAMQLYLRTYSTWHEQSGLYVLCGDNGRFFNHSDTPNTVSDAISFGVDRAGRDLAVGEELTSDYNTICDSVRRNGHDYELVASVARQG
jgi:SET domain-containing protein